MLETRFVFTHIPVLVGDYVKIRLKITKALAGMYSQKIEALVRDLNGNAFSVKARHRLALVSRVVVGERLENGEKRLVSIVHLYRTVNRGLLVDEK